MLKRISYRAAITDDARAFVKLMNTQYDRKIAVEYFSWQYIHPCEPTVLTCAFDGADLIGTFGLKIRVLSNGKVAGQAIDMLVAPDYRERGIFGELVRATLRKVRTQPDLLCVFPNENGRRALVGSLGWTCVGSIATCFLQKNDGELRRSETAPTLCKTRRTAFEKNDRHLHWRFDDHPHYQYRYVRSDEGLVVTKLYKDPLSGRQYGDIVDAIFDDPGRPGSYDLFIRACADLNKNDIEGVMTWALPGSPLSDIAVSLGFRQTAQKRHFCVKILDDACRQLGVLENWDLVPADAEIY